MLPGLLHSPMPNVYTIDFDTNVDDVTIGNVLGTATYLDEVDGPIDLHIQVRAGVTVGATTPTDANPSPALLIDLPAGSRVYIRNYGRIAGAGGRGGEGDRGRRDGDDGSSNFAGGGGGGGAGSDSLGGPKTTYNLHPPEDNEATDGVAGTTTLGGNPGVNWINGTDDGDHVRGMPARLGGDALYFSDNAISIFIDNEFGEIFAGAAGGDGGYQNGSLPGGSVVPVKGDDLAGDVTVLEGSLTTEAKAVCYPTGATLTWVPSGGASYPSVAGYVNRRP
jgi:hypothetical protein